SSRAPPARSISTPTAATAPPRAAPPAPDGPELGFNCQRRFSRFRVNRRALSRFNLRIRPFLQSRGRHPTYSVASLKAYKGSLFPLGRGFRTLCFRIAPGRPSGSEVAFLPAPFERRRSPRVPGRGHNKRIKGQ